MSQFVLNFPSMKTFFMLKPVNTYVIIMEQIFYQRNYIMIKKTFLRIIITVGRIKCSHNSQTKFTKKAQLTLHIHLF